ncbi:MAG TPA: TetR/AcrR family transcriptional regulator [Spirochaetota bacterium]|nr:TetR/AcrR family transcriptional regulator [Spirochaetota bacterium]HPQ54900.1 TetR/AcrR family transcriptional regulator [Spirochaetota bacterium]
MKKKNDIFKKMTHSGEVTRDKILEEALDLFSKKGYSGTSIRDIVHRVGIKGSSLYNHFPGKEAILTTLLDDFNLLELVDRMGIDSPEARVNTLPDALTAITDAMLQFLENVRHKKFIKIVFMELLNETGTSNKIFTDYLDEFRAGVARLLKGFMDRKHIIEGDPLFLANEFILSLTYSQFEFIILNKGAKDLKVLREYYAGHVDFFWQSIRVK